MRLRDLGEAGAIALAAKAAARRALPAGWVGIGDDAAVTDIPGGGRILTTVDILVEGIHFRLGTTSAADLGWKAVAVNVSDIHAMAGRPLWSVVAVSMAAGRTSDWLRSLFDAMADAARFYGAPIVGGDTAGSTGPITLAVTVVGRALHPRLRRDARPGDRLVATGPFGLARAGLWALGHPDVSLDPGFRERAEAHHRRPGLPGPPSELAKVPRFALIDDSDGLGACCLLLAEASGVAIELASARLDLDPAVKAIAGVAGDDPLTWQLWGGEDYGLVAAVPPDVAVPRGWREIGRVAAGSGATLDGKPLAGDPFRHF